MTSEKIHTCLACGHRGTGRYCSNCGQRYELKRISLRTLGMEVVELFTNFDKGFGYTLKRLITHPGTMQRDYLLRDRVRYQKPFSFLFICATAAGLVRYWIYGYLGGGAPLGSEAQFFREYWLFVHLGLMPFYVLITYLFFLRSRFNYAEVGVMIIYLFSGLFLVSAVASCCRLLYPPLDTLWVELPVWLVLVPVTMVRFFKESRTWWTVIRSLLVLLIIMVLVQYGEDWAREWLGGIR